MTQCARLMGCGFAGMPFVDLLFGFECVGVWVYFDRLGTNGVKQQTNIMFLKLYRRILAQGEGAGVPGNKQTYEQ